VGKSGVALCLARQLGGEIVSVDSMQVYRGLDIGTAKASAGDRAAVPHHGIDVCGLEDGFSAADFVVLAREAEIGIRQRGKVPIFCGGTGLYFKAYFEGLSPAANSDATLRRQLEAAPMADLLAEIESADPVTYAQIDRANPRRVVRAVEIIRLTGRSVSSRRTSRRMAGSEALFFCLDRESADLDRRIEARVDEMFRHGLVDETRTLLKQGLRFNRTAMQAIGYRQVVDHLEGRCALSETIARVKTKTRQFARRQRTWFRHQMKAERILLGEGTTAEELAAALAARVEADQNARGRLQISFQAVTTNPRSGPTRPRFSS
jgi:tRNA dimethylallyltransferase